MLALQRASGNAAVAGYLGSVVQRQAAEQPGAGASATLTQGTGAAPPPRPAPPPSPPAAASPQPPRAADGPGAAVVPPTAPVTPPKAVLPRALPALTPPELPAPGDGRAVADAARNGLAALAGLQPDLPATASSPGAQIVVSALAEGAREGRSLLIAAAGEAVTTIRDAAHEQQEAVAATAAATVATATADVAGAREEVQAASQEQTRQLGVTAAGEHATVEAWRAGATTRAAGQVEQHRQAVLRAGEEQAHRTTEAGATAAETTATTLDGGAERARSTGTGGAGGDELVARGRAEVSGRLTADTARQFQEATGDAPRRLTTHAGEAAGTIQQGAASAAATTAAIGPQLTTGLHEAATAAGSALEQATESGAEAVHTAATAATRQLDQGLTGLTDAVGTAARRNSDQLGTSASEAIDAVQQRVREVTAEADQQLQEKIAQVEQAQPEPEVATELAERARGEVVGAYTTAAESVRGAGSTATEPLRAGGGEATQALQGVSAQAAGELAGGTAAVTQHVQTVGDRAGTAMTRISAGTTAAGEEAVAATGGVLAATTAEVGGALQAATDQAGQSLSGQVAQVDSQAGQALTGFQGRIAEGSHRAEQNLAGKEPQAQRTQGLPVQRSWLSAVGNWFAQQWHDFTDLLSSPAFWVGLVVTVVLFPVMGPGALIVGGAVGGAVSGVEQNLRQNRPRYDLRNIVRNAAIGAVAGAAVAFGIGVIAGLGLEGAAAVGAFMVLSAGVGIVVNLVNGDRWDRALLANLFLAWLFASIGESTRGSRDAPGPEGQGQGQGGTRPVARPGELPPSTIDPAVPKLGDFTFTDMPGDAHGNDVPPGSQVATVEVTLPDGRFGHAVRAFDPATGEFHAIQIDLSNIPPELRTVEVEPGHTVPLSDYLTARVMRLLTVEPSAVRSVRIHGVENVRTVLQVARGDAVMSTQTVTTNADALVRAGTGRLVGARVVEGTGTRIPLADLLRTWEGTDPPPEMVARHNEILSRFGLTREQAATYEVLSGFDIELSVATGSSGSPVPVPGPQAHDDQDAGGH